MKRYYTKNGKFLDEAYGEMECKNSRGKDPKEHKPHSWNSEFTLYGPYICAGYPPIKLYDSPPRKPVN